MSTKTHPDDGNRAETSMSSRRYKTMATYEVKCQACGERLQLNVSMDGTRPGKSRCSSWSATIPRRCNWFPSSAARRWASTDPVLVMTA